MTLRQQAPNFAKEATKRSAASNADVVSKLQIKRTGHESDSYASFVGEKESTDNNDECRTSNEEDTIAEDSPFDRSYFRFEDEEYDDGRDHVAHVGGRALDAVVVS